MMIKAIVYTLFFILINHIQAAVCNNSDQDHYSYLQRSDYIPNVKNQGVLSFVVKSGSNEGIKTFPHHYKSSQTNGVGENTNIDMQQARCGNFELDAFNKSQSSNLIPEQVSNGQTPLRFTTLVNMWTEKKLKWFIEKYPKRQKYIKTNDHIRRIIAQAFYDWEKFCALTFEMAKTKEEAHFKIKFVSRDHGDGQPFDGPGTILAHAFEPQSGEIHFDDDETFTDYYIPQNDSFTLRLVAAHVIGHALGVSHSQDENSIMYPVYKQLPPSYELTRNVQLNLQALYGKPDEKINTETRKPPFSPMTSTHSPDLSPNKNWCSGEFQTGCEGPDGELYLFKDNQVWRYQAQKNPSWDLQPTLINQRFPSLTNARITVCVKSKTGDTYLFRNNRMWKLKTHWSSDGPHILRGKNYPQNPHVALLHQNSIYLIRNNLLYRLNELDYNDDLEISEIDTILHPPPDGSIRSGFTYDKQHYIFTKNYVYAYDSINGDLLSGYPKLARNGWFACEKALETPNWKKNTTTVYQRDHYFHRYSHRRRYHHNN